MFLMSSKQLNQVRAFIYPISGNCSGSTYLSSKTHLGALVFVCFVFFSTFPRIKDAEGKGPAWLSAGRYS